MFLFISVIKRPHETHYSTVGREEEKTADIDQCEDYSHCMNSTGGIVLLNQNMDELHPISKCGTL